MKYAVRYFTRTGNTKKLAEAAAAALGVEAADVVYKGLDEKTDIVLLGSSLYAGGFAPDIKAFIEENAEKIGKLAIFGSSASGKSTYKKIRAFAESKGVSVIDREFVCPGHFLFMHKERPDENDLKKVADFAREIAGI